MKKSLHSLLDSILKLEPEDYKILMDALVAVKEGNKQNVDLEKIEQDKKLGVVFSEDNSVLLQFPKVLELESYNVPDGVTRIGTDAFAYCRHLKKITLPSGLKVISEQAFANASIEEIVLPENMTSIGAGAFQYSKLRQITLPEGITEIAEDVFSTTKLKSINIPSSVRTIKRQKNHQQREH